MLLLDQYGINMRVTTLTQAQGWSSHLFVYIKFSLCTIVDGFYQSDFVLSLLNWCLS